MPLLAEGFLNLPGTSELLQLLGVLVCIAVMIILLVAGAVVFLIYRVSQGQRRDETDKKD